LLRDRLDEFEITDSTGKAVKLNKKGWQSYLRAAKEYEGWYGSLQADFGNDAVRFLTDSGFLEEGIDSVTALRKALNRKSRKEDLFETEVVSEAGEDTMIKALNLRTGLARNHSLTGDIFASEELGRLAQVHLQLVKNLGHPPFEVSLGDRIESAEDFTGIHRAVLDLAKHGAQLTRFKGLGEMNAEQLRETTMDPATRTLQRVTLEDATAADQIFSMLMGDQVSPRRDFIETYAREATNLDV
jgi:DNA gyrase subunit B